MSGCLFCKIASGDVPAAIVQRRDDMVAFKDINPQAPTHFLVIPVEHISSLNDARDSARLGAMVAFARDLARELGISEQGYRVVVNTNAGGGQTVFHIHLHVLGGRAMQWPPG